MEQIPKNPLEVFSAEEWQLILGKIDDPKDLWNVVHADDTFFRELLKTKGDTMIATVFPLLYNYLKGKDLLALRQVSKQLKATVDTYMEHGQRWENVDDLGNQKLELWLNSTDVDKLTEKMRALPQGKIPGGCVYAEDPGHEGFFEEFGDKVFHLVLAYGIGDSVKLLKYLENILGNTPKVKTLSLSSSGCEGDEDKVFEYLEENPLPELSNLISLSIFATMKETKDDGGVEKAYHGILRKYESQLEHLSVVQVDDVDFRLRRSMPALTTLCLETYQLRALRSLRVFQAPLQTIDLALHFSAFKIGHVLKILETFMATLKKLCIWSKKVNRKLDELPLIGSSFEFPKRINLPHLEELMLGELYPSIDTSFDFLLGLKNLRRLTLGIRRCKLYLENEWEDMAGLSEHLEQFGSLKDSFYTSPVWKELPRLDKVITCDCPNMDNYKDLVVQTMHTRNGYEDYQDKMAKEVKQKGKNAAKEQEEN